MALTAIGMYCTAGIGYIFWAVATRRSVLRATLIALLWPFAIAAWFYAMWWPNGEWIRDTLRLEPRFKRPTS